MQAWVWRGDNVGLEYCITGSRCDDCVCVTVWLGGSAEADGSSYQRHATHRSSSVSIIIVLYEVCCFTVFHYDFHGFSDFWCYFLLFSFDYCALNYAGYFILCCVVYIFTCAHAASRYCFCQRLCVCLSVCLSAQNLEKYWSEIDVPW